jgi:DNA-binding transcriptional regulator YiaG
MILKKYKNLLRALKSALLGILWFFSVKSEVKTNKKQQKDYRLYSLRVQNGFTQKEAAKYLKTSWYAIHDYEIGRRYPVPERWYRILEARLTSYDL